MTSISTSLAVRDVAVKVDVHGLAVAEFLAFWCTGDGFDTSVSSCTDAWVEYILAEPVQVDVSHGQGCKACEDGILTSIAEDSE